MDNDKVIEFPKEILEADETEQSAYSKALAAAVSYLFEISERYEIPSQQVLSDLTYSFVVNDMEREME